jgi:hypothetical protein
LEIEKQRVLSGGDLARLNCSKFDTTTVSTASDAKYCLAKGCATRSSLLELEKRRSVLLVTKIMTPRQPNCRDKKKTLVRAIRASSFLFFHSDARAARVTNNTTRS